MYLTVQMLLCSNKTDLSRVAPVETFKHLLRLEDILAHAKQNVTVVVSNFSKLHSNQK